MTNPDVFGFELQHCNDVVRVRVFGAVDLAAEEPLVTATTEVLGSGDCASVVLDLTGARFMDSSGLRAVLRCQQNARTHAVEFNLAVADGPVARLFQVAGVAGQFQYE